MSEWKRIVWGGNDGLRDENGHYALPMGKYPSVTKVLDSFNDFLWVHIAKIREGVDDLSSRPTYEVWDALEDGTYELREAPTEELLRDGDYVSKFGLRHMKSAADRGTAIHLLFEAWGLGATPSPDEYADAAEWVVYENNLTCNVEDVKPYFKTALAWLNEVNPSFKLQESVICDPVYGYAGRTDAREVEIGGVKYIADVKTHEKLKRTWLMQLAAYRAAPVVFSRTDGKLVQVDVTQEMREYPGLVIQVTPEKCGCRVVEHDVLSFYTGAFYSLLDAYNAINDGPLPGARAAWVKVEQ